MSSSGSQKVRRNAASPSSSARQGPLRATQQFALFSGTNSPSRKHAIRQGVVSSPTSKNSKHTKTRSHSETAFVCDRRSPTSPVYKVEKPKALRATSSVDNINLYLSGQWPKDGCSKRVETVTNTTHSGDISPSYYSDGVHKMDQHTQTPDEWEEAECRRQVSHSKLALYKRSKSVGSTENWSLKSSKDIKAKLQRKDNSTKGCQSMQRFSPVPVITTSFSAHSTQPIKIPVPLQDSGVLRGTPGKARASVEGLNPEIERLIISATNVREEESHSVVVNGLFEQPDGHRAPVPDVLNNTRSVDTQTPSQTDLYAERFVELSIGEYGGRTSSRASTSDTDDGSRPQSVSPSPFMLGPLDIEEPAPDTSTSDAGRSNITAATSPRPNNSAQFIRLPPDGAEKLKSVVEIASRPPLKNLLAPVIMSTVNLQPSERSAFSSLGKTSTIVPRLSPIRFVEESH